MPGYPEGYLSERPAWTTWAGFVDLLTGKLAAVRRQLAWFLLDALAVGVLWILVSYIYLWYAHRVYGYTLIPWWLFGVLTVELGALWGAFGVSPAQRLSGRRLVAADGSPPRLGQRVVYFLAWHGSVLPIVPLLVEPPLHERASGLRLRPVAATGVQPPPWYRTTTGWYTALLLVGMLVAAIGVTVTWSNLQRLVGDAWRTAKFWRALVSPDTSILQDSFRDLIVTVFMAVMATTFAVVVAVPLSFLAARNLMRGPLGRIVYTVLRGAMSIIRSIEPIVWAILFLVWVTVERAPFAGLLALWVHSIADLVKLYAEQLEGINPGLVEAITATGAGRLAVLRYAVVPQIINPYVSFTLYRWDINIRMATVVGVVGGGGIGQRLYSYVSGQQWSLAGTVMLMIVALVWAIDYLSARLRAKLT